MENNKSNSSNHYDALVIGLGTTGMYAAKELANAGKRVAVFEKGPRGTTCILTGCMPSKSLFVPAHHVAHTQTYESILTPNSKVSISTEKLFTWMKDRRKEFVDYRIDVENQQKFELISGIASFIDAHTITCNDKTYTADYIILSTGSKVSIPPIPGIEQTPYWTSDNVFEQDGKNLKGKSVAVLGGGVIGCEMAQFFNSIGCKVTILARSRPLLSIFDEDQCLLLENIYVKKAMTIKYGTQMTSVSYTDGKFRLIDNKNKLDLSVDHLIVCTGRAPNNPTCIETTQIQLEKNKIVRDDFCQTSQPHIYAGGDLAGIPLLHEARQEGEYIAQHILHNTAAPYTSVKLQIAFTYPHITSVGAREKDLQPNKYLVAHAQFDDGRSILEGATDGAIKLITDLTGTIIGAACVNNFADNLIQQFVPYVQHKLNVKSISDCYHPTQQEVFLDLKEDILNQIKK